ncbi:hypothetical protein FRC08_010207 [Ceratobasidium sp. 394]|nr:hypothetical protein FRC08_010207 [Ceratobasidium sp. 394]KAG9097667.1 hypothetical protein FS749_005770 [Ceratobasidium sp. UAMH 11750]
MPPPNFYHDRWPHSAPENTQNPSMWMQAPAQAVSAPYLPLPPHPQYRRSPQRMGGRATHLQTPPVATRLRTGSNYDLYAAESEYGPYCFEENVSFSVSVPSSQIGSGRGGTSTRTRVAMGWLLPNETGYSPTTLTPG